MHPNPERQDGCSHSLPVRHGAPWGTQVSPSTQTQQSSASCEESACNIAAEVQGQGREPRDPAVNAHGVSLGVIKLFQDQLEQWVHNSVRALNATKVDRIVDFKMGDFMLSFISIFSKSMS